MSTIDSETPPVFAMILAAGVSRRFGADKRQALLPCSRTLLQASIEGARSVFSNIWVVLRADDDPQSLGIPQDVNVVRSPLSHLGMGHSLAAGIGAMQAATSGAAAVAVLLGDMPWINAATLRRLADMANTGRIALPECEGQRGHPVIIGRRFWPVLLELEGDQGARGVIGASPDAVDVLECTDAGILRDVDTPEALI